MVVCKYMISMVVCKYMISMVVCKCKYMISMVVCKCKYMISMVWARKRTYCGNSAQFHLSVCQISSSVSRSICCCHYHCVLARQHNNCLPTMTSPTSYLTQHTQPLPGPATASADLTTCRVIFTTRTDAINFIRHSQISVCADTPRATTRPGK